MASRQFHLPSGRALGVSAIGDPLSTRLVVFCHPSPGAAGFDPNPIASANAGVHILQVDRPGYGSSEPLTDAEPPNIDRFAEDIADYLSASESIAQKTSSTDFGSVAAVGWGFGGLVAAQLAARHPDLVDRLVLVSTDADGVRGGQRHSQHTLNLLSRAESDAAAPELADAEWNEGASINALGLDPDDTDFDMAGLRSRVDRMLADAFVQGAAGARSDQAARRLNTQPEWKKIRAKTLVVAGERDETAGRSDARRLRHAIHKAESMIVQDSGPLAIAAAWTDILEFAGQAPQKEPAAEH